MPACHAGEGAGCTHAHAVSDPTGAAAQPSRPAVAGWEGRGGGEGENDGREGWKDGKRMNLSPCAPYTAPSHSLPPRGQVGETLAQRLRAEAIDRAHKSGAFDGEELRWVLTAGLPMTDVPR